MFFFRLVFTAMRSLETHFLRSLLATLGVLIGVASVVSCMSILEGFSNDIARRFKSLGSNLIYVTPAVARIHGQTVGTAQTLDLDDLDTLKRELDAEIEFMAPEAIGQAVIKRFQKSETYNVICTSEAYFELHAFEAQRGGVISAAQAHDETANVICLGNKVAEELFGGMDPVGQAVKVRNSPYRVIGVLEEKGNLGFLNVDECVFIPIATGLKRFVNRDYLDRITISAADPKELDSLEKNLARVLRREHNIGVAEEDDFKVFNQEEQLQNLNQVMLIYKIVFYSIAGISLLVGGIGIMNIMLVSVTERTREIGVRMAVGARRMDIMLQFIVEALVISLIGGIFGLLLGAMFADLLNKTIEGFFKTEITTQLMVIAIGTATIVGVFSGIYPASKASRLDPVESLRYE